MKKKKVNWKKITAREYGVQYSEMQIRSLTDDVKEFLPFTSYQQIIIPEENNQCFFIAEDKWDEIIKSLHRKYSASLALLAGFENQFRKLGASYLKTAKKMAELNLKRLGNKDLGSLYIKYQEALLKYCVFVWAGYILNILVAEKAKKVLEEYVKKSGKQKNGLKIQEAVFKPIKKAAILQLQKEIEKLQKNWQEKDIHNIYLKYRWLSCLDIHNKPWEESAFREYIKSFKLEKKERFISAQKIVEELKVKEKDKIYLEMARRFAYIVDARDDFRRQAVFYARSFFSEIAKRMGIKLKDISFLQEKEIIAFLDEGKRISNKTIRERQKGFVLYYDKKKNIVCKQGKIINQIIKNFGLDSKQKTIQTIKGTVACRGKVKGNATIVKGLKDLKKVKDKDVMITITTHPDYVLAMRKASAIVTDEGGITCHAAIVSRELGIPCIVGTKLATKLFKDGDFIEVDANKGLVTKLN